MTDDAFRAAVETMREIRDRCVWTQAIGHAELVPYLVEESAELIEAVEAGTPADLREELGDVLWQVLFHAEIASRDVSSPFDIDDVARDLTAKMIRRHPHVFGEETAETPAEVLRVWTAAKAEEKRHRTSVLDGVTDRMPSLAHAQKVLGRAGGVGVRPAPGHVGTGAAEPADEAELGDALLVLVGLADARGWDAERALRSRVREVEAEVRRREVGRASQSTRSTYS